MSDYRKLENHPLVLVLVEIRYSPILNIKKYLPELQDQLRHSFPQVDRQVDKSINVTEDHMEVSDVERWLFRSKDSGSFVDIDSNRVIFATTNYDRFDGFKTSTEKIVKIINEVLNPSYFSRIGLRYCDTIIPKTEEDLTKLVHPQLLIGDAYDGLGQKGFNRQETLIQTGTTHLVIRSMQARTTLVAPEDISRAPINLNHSENPSLRLILDFDHFWQDDQNQCDFEVALVLEKLNSLHELSRKAFWCVTTEFARNEVWQ